MRSAPLRAGLRQSGEGFLFIRTQDSKSSCQLPVAGCQKSRSEEQLPASSCRLPEKSSSEEQLPASSCRLPEKTATSSKERLAGVEQQRIYIFLTISQFLCRIIKGFNRFAYRLSTLVLKERLAAS